MAKRSEYNERIFIEQVVEAFKKTYTKLDDEMLRTFIGYCIGRNIITDSTVNKYAILKEFERLRRETDMSGKKIMYEISSLSELSITRVYSVMNHDQRRFYKRPDKEIPKK